MIERVALKLHRTNKYIVNAIGYDNLYHLISVANVLDSENPKQVEEAGLRSINLKKEILILKKWIKSDESYSYIIRYGKSLFVFTMMRYVKW